MLRIAKRAGSQNIKFAVEYEDFRQLLIHNLTIMHDFLI